jgi:hypothetical protein
MLESKKVRLISCFVQYLGKVTLAVVKVVVKTGMREPNHAVRVRIAARPERRTGRAALRSGAEVAREAYPFGCETIKVRRPHIRDAIAAHMPAQIVANHDDNVGLAFRHDLRSSLRHVFRPAIPHLASETSATKYSTSYGGGRDTAALTALAATALL